MRIGGIVEADNIVWGGIITKDCWVGGGHRMNFGKKWNVKRRGVRVPSYVSEGLVVVVWDI